MTDTMSQPLPERGGNVPDAKIAVAAEDSSTLYCCVINRASGVERAVVLYVTPAGEDITKLLEDVEVLHRFDFENISPADLAIGIAKYLDPFLPKKIEPHDPALALYYRQEIREHIDERVQKYYQEYCLN